MVTTKKETVAENPYRKLAHQENRSQMQPMEEDPKTNRKKNVHSQPVKVTPPAKKQKTTSVKRKAAASLVREFDDPPPKRTNYANNKSLLTRKGDDCLNSLGQLRSREGIQFSWVDSSFGCTYQCVYVDFRACPILYTHTLLSNSTDSQELGRVYFEAFSYANLNATDKVSQPKGAAVSTFRVGDFVRFTNGNVDKQAYRIVSAFQATKSFEGFQVGYEDRVELQKRGHPYLELCPLSSFPAMKAKAVLPGAKNSSLELFLSLSQSPQPPDWLLGLDNCLEKISVSVVPPDHQGPLPDSMHFVKCTTQDQHDLLTCASHELVNKYAERQWPQIFRAKHVLYILKDHEESFEAYKNIPARPKNTTVPYR